MIGYIMVGTNDLDRAIKFYDELFKILDLERIETDDVCAGYSQKGSDGKVEFYVTKPVNKKEATIGNGSQISFITNSKNSNYQFSIINNIEANNVDDQGRTSTCWSFSALSFFESEIMRIKGEKIELSEMVSVRNTL
jgi:C1A family cysteine protease